VTRVEDWRARWLWLTLAVIAADRATKYAIEQFTSESYRRELVPHVAFLVHNVNMGIAFGLFSESASRWISLVLIVSSSAVVAVLVWLLVSGRAAGVFFQAGIALIAGGAAGNLLDRVLHGGVTDFLELHGGRFVWPAFNLADSAITVGALLALWELVSDGRGHSVREHV
jgi:signal peptidase II